MTSVKKHVLVYSVIPNNMNMIQHNAVLADIIIIIIYCKPKNIVHRIETVLFYFCVYYYNFVGFLFI